MKKLLIIPILMLCLFGTAQITATQARAISLAKNAEKKQVILDDIALQIDAVANGVDAVSSNTVLNYATNISDSTKSLNFISNKFTPLGFTVTPKWNVAEQRWTVKINW